MNILHLGGNCISVPIGLGEIAVSGIDIIPSCELGGEYPMDISLNIALIDRVAVVGTKNINYNILQYISSQSYNIIKVKQGYCKCSICIVDDGAIITDDENIARALHNYLDVLLISKGNIELKGYNYGFIGGTCGLIDKNLLAFTGNIEKHSDYDNIKSFLDNHGCDFVCLSDKNLVDIGGILPLKTV
ncbi:MAG: hypothetical protein RSC41_02120 [Oscillospiraceae bacterium]